MLSGRSFSLRTSTAAIDTTDGKRFAVPLPAGTIIKVISGPKGNDRMVDVLVDGKVLVMFAVDLHERGDEVTGADA